jgi:6-phosphogluconolactonase
LETAIGAHAIQTDPSNTFAFVPHIDNRGGPNAIFQFKFDPNTGHLTPNSPPRVGQPTGTGPRHFCFHPSKDLLYFSNEQGSSVTGYNFDPANGTLSAFQTISTLPTGYEQSNTCSQIQISPSGKFLYAPNRGHNSIAGFSVDASSGRLTAIGHVSTEERPSAFSLDPEGHFLFAAGSETDVLTATIGWTVLLSVVLHGLTAAPLARRYGQGIAAIARDMPEREPADEPRPATMHWASDALDGPSRPSDEGQV